MIDKKSCTLLKHLYKVEEIKAEDACKRLGQQYKKDNWPTEISALLADKYICPLNIQDEPDGEGGYLKTVRYYKITVAGRAFVEQRRRDRRNFWVPYAITTFVAVASLIVSLIDIFYKG